MYIDLNKELTDEQKMLKERTHEFAAQVLRPAAWELDKLTPEEVIAAGIADAGRLPHRLRAGVPPARLPGGARRRAPRAARVAHRQRGDGLGRVGLLDRAQRHVVPVRLRVEPPGPAA